jgi:hypothetical protein
MDEHHSAAVEIPQNIIEATEGIADIKSNLARSSTAANEIA